MTTTDDKGRVLRQSELIADDLFTIVKDCLVYDPRTQSDVIQQGKLIKDLTAYIMESRNEDFYAGERVGLTQGRKEAGSMFLSAFDAELERDYKEAIAGRNNTIIAVLDKLKPGILDEAKRAVAAISKSTGSSPTPVDASEGRKAITDNEEAR